MSSIYLSLWETVWLVAKFDEASHKIRRIISSSKYQIRGFAHKHKSAWFVVYEKDKKLVLFHGGVNYEIGDISIDLAAESEKNSLVKISSGSKTIFSDRVALGRLMDFPSSAEEQRQENFFFWLKSIVADPKFKGDMIRLWSKK